MAENKEYMIHQEEDGAIQISEDVVASIASTTASEVEGVSAMMGGSVGGKKMSAKGVRVEMDGDGIVVNLFIVVRYGSAIGDLIYFDANADGAYQPAAGDSGIASVTVVLLNAGGKVVASTITDANGNYLFPELPAGTYTV